MHACNEYLRKVRGLGSTAVSKPVKDFITVPEGIIQMRVVKQHQLTSVGTQTPKLGGAQELYTYADTVEPQCVGGANSCTSVLCDG